VVLVDVLKGSNQRVREIGKALQADYHKYAKRICFREAASSESCGVASVIVSLLHSLRFLVRCENSSHGYAAAR
jgi:hypothetical protein